MSELSNKRLKVENNSEDSEIIDMKDVSNTVNFTEVKNVTDITNEYIYNIVKNKNVNKLQELLPHLDKGEFTFDIYKASFETADIKYFEFIVDFIFDKLPYALNHCTEKFIDFLSNHGIDLQYLNIILYKVIPVENSSNFFMK
jgi:hypothetical protein